MEGSEVIIEELKAHDVDYVFGLSGGEDCLHLRAEKAGLEHILCRDERAGVFEAATYAETTGKPGVVIGHPIGMYIPHGLLACKNAGIPIVSVIWDYDYPMNQRYPSHMETKWLKPVLDAVTKDTIKITSANNISDMVRTAFREATTEPLGPVALVTDIGGALNAEADSQPHITKNTEFSNWNPQPGGQTIPKRQRIEDVAKMLLDADRPVMMVGGNSGPYLQVKKGLEEIYELAELLAIPLSRHRHRVKHPLSIGFPLISEPKFGMGTICQEVVSDSDLVFLVGSKAREWDTDDWRIPDPAQKIVQLYPEAEPLGKNYPDAITLQGDTKPTIQAIIEVVKEQGVTAPDPLEEHPRVQELEQRKRQFRTKRSEIESSDDVPIHPARLFKEIRSFIDEDTILTGGGGTMCWYPHNHLPGNYVYGAFLGMGEISAGVPGAIGIQVGAPDKRVVEIDGDGGFMYHLGELETAVRHDLPVTWIVGNNKSLWYEKWDALEKFPDRETFPTDLLDSYCDFTDVNFGEVAKALGCWGRRVEEPNQLQSALQEALESDRPAVIDVPIKEQVDAPVSRTYLENF